MTHAVGKGIIDLIAKHEPLALKLQGGEPEAARRRVLNDLGDSVGGLLAFTLESCGADAALASAAPELPRLENRSDENEQQAGD